MTDIFFPSQWQNAEVVSASLDKYVELLEDLRDGELPSAEEIQALHDEMVENTEAMESILLCTSHQVRFFPCLPIESHQLNPCHSQGRIADDILNVSKLNMGLLTINLTAFELIPRIVEVKRIFEAECSQKQIDLRLIAGRSVTELNANWIMGDPARLHQILLNFLSNSISALRSFPVRFALQKKTELSCFDQNIRPTFPIARSPSESKHTRQNLQNVPTRCESLNRPILMFKTEFT